MSRKLVLAVLCSTLMVFSEDVADTTKVEVKTTEKQLSAEEKVLAGVLLINDSYSLSPSKKHEYYKALLKECNISHEQFKRYLESSKRSSKEWDKSLKKLNDVFE